AAALAPGAGRLLDLLQPAGGALHHRVGHVEADGFQPGEDLPGPVDVVDAPAAVPAAVRFLRATQVGDGAVDRSMAGSVAGLAERFQDAGGDVGAARVEHGVVVGERDLGEYLAVDVAVERPPAAVAVLHPEYPAEAALDGQPR